MREADILFEAMLMPHRSLPPIGFVLVMGILITVSMAIGIGFTLIGAWPVIGFLGIDVLLVYLAFRISYGAARQCELVRLSAGSLEILLRNKSGMERRVALKPYWVRVDIERVNAKRTRLVIRSHGDVLELGGFLGLEEKQTFAAALEDALHRNREAIPVQAGP